MADYLPPDARRRMGNALMAAQYDRATPEEGNVVQRHGLLPLGTYDNGRTGLAFPGFVAEPVQSFNRLLQNGYTPGDTQGVEDAFNVAGAAMMGGFAAPKPRNVVGSAGGELKGAALGAIPDTPGIRAYHGSKGEIAGGVFDPAHSRDFGTHFGTQDQANYFGRMRGGREGGGAVYPVDLRFQNPLEIPHVFGWKPDNVAKAAEQARPSLQGLSDDVQRAADTARQAPGFNSVLNYRDVVEAQKEALRKGLESRGVDGLQYRNQTLAEGEGMSYIPISRGTTYSATTGDLLYANGGRPGATAGAALGAIPDTPGPMRVYHGTSAPQKFDKFNRPPWMTENPDVASGAAYYETPAAIRHLVPENLHYPEGRVFPLDIEPKNPFVVDMTQGATPIEDAFARLGYKPEADPHAAAAKMGHDFFIYKNFGEDFGVRTPHTQIVPLQQNTVKSATTGDLLYANGGRGGAATGAALGGVDIQDPALAEILRQYGLDIPSRPASPQYRPGDA